MKKITNYTNTRISSCGFSSVPCVNPKTGVQAATLFVPRAKLDRIVSLVSENQKLENQIKSILTQRKLDSSKIDLGRIEANLTKYIASSTSLLGYITKASATPKAAKSKTVKTEVDLAVLVVAQADNIT